MVGPEEVGVSSERLWRIRPVTEKWVGDDRITSAITLLSLRQIGSSGLCGHDEPGEGYPHVARHHIPHLVDGQAHHLRGLDDALRARVFPAVGPCLRLATSLQRPRRLSWGDCPAHQAGFSGARAHHSVSTRACLGPHKVYVR
jgi:hypothetical protein